MDSLPDPERASDNKPPMRRRFRAEPKTNPLSACTGPMAMTSMSTRKTETYREKRTSRRETPPRSSTVPKAEAHRIGNGTPNWANDSLLCPNSSKSTHHPLTEKTRPMVMRKGGGGQDFLGTILTHKRRMFTSNGIRRFNVSRKNHTFLRLELIGVES